MKTAVTVEPHAEGFRTRLRFGNGNRQRFVIKLRDEAEAKRRAVQLQDLADALSAAGCALEAPIILKKAGEATNDQDFQKVVKIADGLCENAGKPRRLKLKGLTVRELGERWTDGRLHRDYPDQIKLKKTSDDDEGRFKLYIYPQIGNKPIDAVTLDDCEEIMRRLPAHLSPLSRRAVGGQLARLFKLAVYPMRLLERSPLPSGFVPQKGARKALAYLYPDEDRRLLQCEKVPLEYRLLWGFMAREGMRWSEARLLTWADLDLRRGVVHLDRNKTDSPRSWTLDTGTATVLRTYRERMRADAEQTDRVFLTPEGGPHFEHGAARRFREHLEAVGLELERPELFTSTPQRRKIRAHDLRATFITVSLANGKTESWISDRTGHTSSAMLNKYKRVARSFEELGLQALVPLDQALPEFREGEPVRPKIETGWAKGGPEIHDPASKHGLQLLDSNQGPGD